jgi:predicted naringenin-chalcone synthase
MYIRGIGTATPAARYSKSECLAAFQDSEWFGRLDARSHLIARTVLQRDNGIESRRLAVDSLADVFAIDPDTLARRFLANAPALATRAAERAIAAAALDPADIDAVVVSTCTGYLCPGLTGYVIERLGLSADVQAFDLVGHGCAAALPNLQLARALLSSDPCSTCCRSVSR